MFILLHLYGASIFFKADIAFATMETESVQPFLDASFGAEGRYVPIRPPKVFEYQEQNYMVIWAYDNEKEKNQKETKQLIKLLMQFFKFKVVMLYQSLLMVR